MKNGKVNGAGKGCFYFHMSHTVGGINLVIYNSIELEKSAKIFYETFISLKVPRNLHSEVSESVCQIRKVSVFLKPFQGTHPSVIIWHHICEL